MPRWLLPAPMRAAARGAMHQTGVASPTTAALVGSLERGGPQGAKVLADAVAHRGHRTLRRPSLRPSFARPLLRGSTPLVGRAARLPRGGARSEQRAHLLTGRLTATARRGATRRGAA